MVVEHGRLACYLVVVEHDRLGGYWCLWSMTDWVVTGGCGA